MRSIFYIALSAFALLAAAADNPFNVPAGGYQFTAGLPTTLSWKPTTSGPVTLKLHKGSDITPESGIVLAASIANSGSFTFIPSPSLGTGNDYTIEIIDDTNPNNFNFTPKFSISGTTGSASSQSVSATKSITSSSTSTSTESTSSRTTSESSSSTLTTRTSSTSTRTSSTASATNASQTTAAPNPNAAISLKLPGGMLAVLGIMALL